MTTIKLTDKQVQALFYAIQRAEMTHDGYDQEERKEYGHAAIENSWTQILTKLEKEGWS